MDTYKDKWVQQGTVPMKQYSNLTASLRVVFSRLFKHAEQRSFVPPIMTERNITCLNKKTNMDKNSIQRNSWTFGSPAGQKI